MAKKKLIYENQNLYKDIERGLKQFSPVLIELKESYEKLEIGEYSNDVHKMLLTEGSRRVEKQYWERIDAQIKQSGITSKIIISNMKVGSEAPINEFCQSLKKAKNFKPILYTSISIHMRIQYLSYIGGAFFVSEKDKEQILEQECRVYLETDFEHELYGKILVFEDIRNEIINLVNKTKFPRNRFHSEGSFIDSMFFKHENDVKIVNAHAIKSLNEYLEMKNND